MTEPLDAAPLDVPALESLAGDPVLAAQQQEYKSLLLTQMRSQQETMMAQAREQARLEFDKWKAEAAQLQQIQAYVQDATSPTMRRPHALPIEAEALTTFLMGISAEQRKTVTAMFDRVLESGLVSFEEIGSAGDGKPEQSKIEEFEALVAEKKATGMAQSAALRAAAKARPDLYAAYSGRAS